MRVLHIGLYDRVGGACIAGYRQHLALREEGVDSHMLVRFKTTEDHHVHELTPTKKIIPRIKRVLWRYRLRMESRRLIRSDRVFLDDRSENAGLSFPGLRDFDVIHIQSFWRFVDLPSLFQSLPGHIPLVFTMHEMAPFTGGCDYAGSCRQFETQCSRCPMLRSGIVYNPVFASWKRKHDIFRKNRKGGIHFVAVSHWLAEEARKSSLLEGLPLSVIHSGIDTKIYRPLGRSVARQNLQIPEDLPVVCFAATNPNDNRKGLRHLVSALKKVRQIPLCLTWGATFPKGLTEFSVRHLGPISSEYLMALAYCAADVFVMPSEEEAFGLTALEAISCGVPVAAFSAGGISDTVLHERTGLLAQTGDTAGLAVAIEKILSDREMRQRLGDEARRHAINQFSMGRTAKKYMALYQQLIAGKTR